MSAGKEAAVGRGQRDITAWGLTGPTATTQEAPPFGLAMPGSAATVNAQGKKPAVEEAGKDYSTLVLGPDASHSGTAHTLKG